jgi:hypothetical protein
VDSALTPAYSRSRMIGVADRKIYVTPEFMTVKALLVHNSLVIPGMI